MYTIAVMPSGEIRLGKRDDPHHLLARGGSIYLAGVIETQGGRVSFYHPIALLL